MGHGLEAPQICGYRSPSLIAGSGLIVYGPKECEERAFEARVSRHRKCPVRIGQL